MYYAGRFPVFFGGISINLLVMVKNHGTVKGQMITYTVSGYERHPMNTTKLKSAEKAFLTKYPGGMAHQEMQEIAKKHRMDKLVDHAHESFKKSAFGDKDVVAENMIKLVTRSSMVSVFEKPKFRDGLREMPVEDRHQLVDGLYQLLHGNEEKGFNMMLEVLAYYKLAKWTIMSVFRCYYYPGTDLLYKPTTVKKVIDIFELEGLEYKPKPSYQFFSGYREAFNEMKKQCDPSLSPSNPAFSGFLWMVMQGL